MKRGRRLAVEPPERRTIDWKEALRLRGEGLTDSEIGRQLGFRSGSITRCLKNHGAPRPSRVSTDPRAAKPELRSLRSAWEKMRRRCEDPTYPPYEHHGNLGVRVCKAWQSFGNFSTWARANGFERGLWLVRKKWTGPYSPGNCRWVAPGEGRKLNARGRISKPRGWAITAFGETKSAAEWARDPRCVVSISGLLYRIRQGVLPEQALTEPRIKVGGQQAAKRRAFGEVKSLREWVRDPRCVVSESSLRERLQRGVGLEEALTLPRYLAEDSPRR